MLESAFGYLNLFSDLNPTEREKLYNNFSIELVMFVHGKKCAGRPVYKSFDEVKSAFMKRIVGAANLQNTMSSGTVLLWAIIEDETATAATTASKTKPDQKAAAVSSKVASIVEHTNLQAECERRGFVTGCTVICKATKNEWSLVKLSPVAADIEMDGKKEEVKLGDLIDNFKSVEIFETKIQALDKYPDPSKHPDLQAELAKGVKRAALAKAYDEHSVIDSFDMRTFKKQRHLHSTAALKKGELVLVPLTWNIALAKSKEDIPPSHVQFGVASTGDVASIVPTKIEKDEKDDLKEDKKEKTEFMVPYWLVKGTAEEEDVNLVEGHVVVNMEGASVQVPVLRNSKKVNPGDCLLKFCPPKNTEAVASSPSKKAVPKTCTKGKGRGKGKGRF